jgi:renalase
VIGTVNSPGTVLVIGAGISGLACARALQAINIPTRVVERSRAVGGRMASRHLEGRLVDLGAASFTADLTSPFGAVVQDWLDRGLARPWTDTFSVAEPEHPLVTKAGPVRYAAPGGLRSLVTDLAAGLEIELKRTLAPGSVQSVGPGSGARPGSGSGPGASVDGDEFAAVVLAMPDPQARRVLDHGNAARSLLNEESAWAPTIAVALGWSARFWPADFHGAFVNGSPTLSFLADDGDRRGDGAPVLVAHSSRELAEQHLADPDTVIAPMTDATRALLGISDKPVWSYAHRWTFARPAAAHPEPFHFEAGIGVCGDAWGAPSAVGTAWNSGDALGRAIAESLVRG